MQWTVGAPKCVPMPERVMGSASALLCRGMRQLAPSKTVHYPLAKN